jgi:hypothetical protein
MQPGVGVDVPFPRRFLVSRTQLDKLEERGYLDAEAIAPTKPKRSRHYSWML